MAGRLAGGVHFLAHAGFHKVDPITGLAGRQARIQHGQAHQVGMILGPRRGTRMQVSHQHASRFGLVMFQVFALGHGMLAGGRQQHIGPIGGDAGSRTRILLVHGAAGGNRQGQQANARHHADRPHDQAVGAGTPFLFAAGFARRADQPAGDMAARHKAERLRGQHPYRAKRHEGARRSG